MRVPKILKVLYSPTKVFKEIAENPSYTGVILILVLFVASNILVGYVTSTKYYFQKVKPNLFEGGNDTWTENATLWVSNSEPTENNDAVYGKNSISFPITNKSELYMQLKFPENINCTAQEFNQTSFSLKLVNSSVTPSNVSITLFSGETGYFVYYLNLTEKIKNWYVWNNITVSLGEKETRWNGENASWSSINGIKFSVKFPKNVNATMLLDALFFRGQYESATKFFALIVSQYSIVYSMSFFMFWIIFGGLLYILTKYAGSELKWKHNLIISGYSLAPLFIQELCIAGIFLFLPRINIALGTVTVASEIPGTLIFDLAAYSQFIFLAWAVVISTFAVRTLNNFTTGKSMVISLASYLMAFVFVRFFGLLGF